METAGEKTVVITGAASGIGEACALFLARKGWRVFAGVLSEAEGDSLLSRHTEKLHPLVLDVTDAKSVERACQEVLGEIGEGELHALINNAGISVTAPMELVSVEDMQSLFEVNVFGAVRTSQAFIPMLRRSRGRIVNIGSSFAWVALPYVGPYAASKAALERVTDSFRYELKPWHIHVALVAVGAVGTSIWAKSTAAAVKASRKMSVEDRSIYNWPAAIQALSPFAEPANQVHTDSVAEAVWSALMDESPRDTYKVGSSAREFHVLRRLASSALRAFIVRRALRSGRMPRLPA